MAIVTGTNVSSPNVIKWATAGSDPFERATHVAGVTEDFDLHDHSENKGLGIKRVQTTVAPTAAGHVRVNADTWQWWASSAAAVRTAVDVEGTQTISGSKTFSATVTLGNGVADAGANNGFFRSNASVLVQIDHDNNATTEVFGVRSNAGGTEVFSVSETGTVTTSSGLLTCPTSANLTLRSPTSLILEIDQDNNSTTEVLVVRSNGSGTNLVSVDESGNVALGGTPATTGLIRLPNNQYVYARNAANNGDLVLLGLDGSNRCVVGQATTTLIGGILSVNSTTGGSQFGSPTGGDKGSGTVNAQAVYDDNTLLTDYVFEPDYALLPIGEMRAFYEEHKHLPTIPGRDEWEREGSFPLGKIVTRLWETVECQARYIAELDGKIAALAGA